MVIDDAKIAEYRLGWQQSQAEEQQALEALRARAWEAARRSPLILRRDFSAARIRLFGSLIDPDSFRRHSDIDLAAEGIPTSLVLKAWCAISSASPEFTFDLVTPDECRDVIWAAIEREGMVI